MNMGEVWKEHDENIEKFNQLKNAVQKLQKLVDEQAEDDGIWFIAESAPEAYLQQELRKIHKLIEEAWELVWVT